MNSSLHCFLHPKKSPYHIYQSNLTAFSIWILTYAREGSASHFVELILDITTNIYVVEVNYILGTQWTMSCISQILTDHFAKINRQKSTTQILLGIKTTDFVIILPTKELCISGRGYKDLKFKHKKAYFVQICWMLFFPWLYRNDFIPKVQKSAIKHISLSHSHCGKHEGYCKNLHSNDIIQL